LAEIGEMVQDFWRESAAREGDASRQRAETGL